MDPGGHSDPRATEHAPLQAGLLEPADAPKRPPGHTVQSEALPREYRPGAHSPEQELEVRPAGPPNEPGAHALQVELYAKEE